MLASSCSRTARALARLVLSPHRPPGCSTDPVPARSARLLVLFMRGLCSRLPCPVSVPSAPLLGMVLACTAGFDGSPSCSTGPLHARSAILLALPCLLMVCALVCLALSLYRPRSCLPCLVSARSALLLVPSLYRLRSCSPRPVPVSAAFLLTLSRPFLARWKLGFLVLSLHCRYIVLLILSAWVSLKCWVAETYVFCDSHDVGRPR